MPFKFSIQHALEREGCDVSDVLKRVVNSWRFQIWGLASGWESGIPAQSSAREIIEGIVEGIVNEYGKKVGKPTPQVWLDHTPQNIRHTQTLLDLFPEARMIHIVRDGRAVASSLMRVDWGPNEVQEAAHFWVESLAHGFAAELLFGPERVMRVRYEDLVQDPGSTLKRLCPRLDIRYELETSRGLVSKPPATRNRIIP
jgi:hypothetical protein